MAGSVGPVGRALAPLGPIGLDQARQAFAEQIHLLSSAGADVIVLETFADLREMIEAVKACGEACDLPVIAQMTFNEDGRTLAGDTPVDAVRALESLDVDVIGTNCTVGSEPMLRVAEEMAGVSKRPLSARPNAGFPAYQDGRFMYLSSPDYVARHARRMVESGVTLVGGCCGTSPAHIAAIRDALHGVRSSRVTPSVEAPARRPQRMAATPAAAEPTGLSRKLGHKFVVTVEVDPPKGFDVSQPLSALSALKDSGLVDAINVADNPRAQSRMSALAMSSLIQGRLGMETILHVALRHRNLVALHSELLGAHALGVRNIFVVMGDLPRVGDYPDATSISDITASGSIELIKGFNSGVDGAGRPIEQATSYAVGCALNLGASDLDRELKVLDRKVKAEADFILTQPVHTARTVEDARRRLGGFPAPLLLGVLPLRSLRHAEFLHNEVPGMSIPDEVMDRMRQSGQRAQQVGIELCQEMLREVHGSVAGVYVMPPFGRYETVLQVLDGIEDLVSPEPIPQAQAARP